MSETVKRYRLIAGTFSGPGPDTDVIHRKGAIIESDQDLVKKWGKANFQLVVDPVAEAAPAEAPKPAAIIQEDSADVSEDGEEVKASPYGDDVTNRFPEATAAELLVFYSKSEKRYRVCDKHQPDTEIDEDTELTNKDSVRECIKTFVERL